MGSSWTSLNDHSNLYIGGLWVDDDDGDGDGDGDGDDDDDDADEADDDDDDDNGMILWFYDFMILDDDYYDYGHYDRYHMIILGIN